MYEAEELEFLADKEDLLVIYTKHNSARPQHIKNMRPTLIVVLQNILFAFSENTRYNQLEVVLKRWNLPDRGHRVIVTT